MATEDQPGIRAVFQVTREVCGQGFEDLCLTVDQSTLRMLGGGSSGRKVNTVEGKLRFQLLDLRVGRRRSFHVHSSGGCGRERRIAVIADIASDRDPAWLYALGIQGGA